MHAKVVLQLVGSMDHLRLVWQTGETLLESVTFAEDPEGNRYNVLLAVQEMVTNVLRHGYHHDEHEPIEIEFALTNEQLQIELRDRGPEFDPIAHGETEAAAGNEMPTEAGGFGIHIAQMVMDELSYVRRDGWNCLRLTKEIAVKAGI
ncbi:MAG: ATP-binding protein [Planctomycetes bacterium]|nr:ATP-binding protein [Planctomycetota bacterium]